MFFHLVCIVATLRMGGVSIERNVKVCQGFFFSAALLFVHRACKARRLTFYQPFQSKCFHCLRDYSKRVQSEGLLLSSICSSFFVV